MSVEGESDKLALTTLLKPLVDKKNSEGIAIESASVGQSGKHVEQQEGAFGQVSEKSILDPKEQQESAVVLLPDLYPYNVGVPHANYSQLRGSVLNSFGSLPSVHEEDFKSRFEVFCFKHDL